MPLSLTPKRAAENLIICDEPAVVSALKSLPPWSLDCKRVTVALESIDHMKTAFDATVAPRVMVTVRGNSIA
jgi:hypothetical protein